MVHVYNHLQEVSPAQLLKKEGARAVPVTAVPVTTVPLTMPQASKSVSIIIVIV